MAAARGRGGGLQAVCRCSIGARLPAGPRGSRVVTLRQLTGSALGVSMLCCALCLQVLTGLFPGQSQQQINATKELLLTRLLPLPVLFTCMQRHTIRQVALEKLQEEELALPKPPQLGEAGPQPMDSSPARPAGGGAAGASASTTPNQSPEGAPPHKRLQAAGGEDGLLTRVGQGRMG